MATIIQKISEQIQAKQIDTTTAFGRSWLIQYMNRLSPTFRDRAEIIRDREQQRSRIMIGRFYFFFYNPKTKENLPYWDRFPMVIPLKGYSDGFLGLNLHYIYPKDRLILLQQLSRTMTGPVEDERSRLRLSYPILQAMHMAYRATPCIKRYLKPHIMSRFVEVPPTEWNIAAVLPVQVFTGKVSVHKQDVWQDSKEKY
jgi:hypothetical protein